jgi:hypothetical protein
LAIAEPDAARGCTDRQVVGKSEQGAYRVTHDGLRSVRHRRRAAACRLGRRVVDIIPTECR